MPVNLIDLADETERPAAYTHKLLLCRTDQHVVWRGDALPDVPHLIDLLRGAAPRKTP